MRGIHLILLILLGSTSQSPASSSFSHEIWNTLLKKYVSADGRVDYKGMMSEKDKLQTYLNLLSSNSPKEDWLRNDQMAFWINAYNAFTVKAILDHYPVKSIQDIDNGKVWDEPFIPIGTGKYSLNNIEHDILRKKFGDPRIHFAINCASHSCPRLLNEAFTTQGLYEQLNAAAKGFVNDPSKNKITASSVRLSSIFEWYKDDFTKKGTLIDFINQYSAVKISSNATVSYLIYDWSLNE